MAHPNGGVPAVHGEDRQALRVRSLTIAGSATDSLYMPEQAFSTVTGTADEELLRSEGATHIEAR